MLKKIPKHITLILNETDTIFLLSISSSTNFQDTNEGISAIEDNILYERLTSETGRSRKVVSIGVQTIPYLNKTRHTQPMKIAIKENSTFVSNWEMFDTYNSHYTTTNQVISKTCEDLFKSEKFLEAVTIIERLLASNSYNKQQKRFKGLIEKDIYRLDIHYKYRLDHLWSFCNEYTKNRCVTAIALNPLSEDILAVGYGKYYLTDPVKSGVVMIWNIKNPNQPEREHFFYHSVTSLAFSKKNPNLIAVGFYNGDIKILNTNKKDFEVVKQDCSSSFVAAWKVIWFEEEHVEKLMACFGDGRVYKYEITECLDLKRIEIMRTCKIEAKLKGIDSVRLFEGNHISSTRYAAAEQIIMHSADPYTYYLTTNEGVMHRCYINLYNQHLSVLKLHEGSVNAIKFSPFANKLFATCGDDFSFNIWADDIDKPLICSRYSFQFVQDLDWSPSHSTIIVNIRGKDIFMWDLQRKIVEPESVTRSPHNALNTVCKFINSGRCLLVGDIDGNLSIFAVEEIPFPAFFQENSILQSLKRILATNPEMLKKLERMKSLNYDKDIFTKHFK